MIQAILEFFSRLQAILEFFSRLAIFILRRKFNPHIAHDKLRQKADEAVAAGDAATVNAMLADSLSSGLPDKDTSNKLGPTS